MTDHRAPRDGNSPGVAAPGVSPPGDPLPGSALPGAGAVVPGARDDDTGAFGDSGRFGDVAPRSHEINWPTVLVSAAVAAIVSSLFLALGVVGLQRSADSPAEVVVAVDPRGAVTVDGQLIEAGASPSSSDPATTTPPAAPAATSSPGGGGLSPATGAASASSRGGPDGTGGTPAGGGGPADSPPAAAAQGDGDAPQVEAAPGGAAADTAESLTGWNPPGPLPADFAVTADDPTLDDLNAIVHLLVATPADDAAKARNLEAGTGGVVVPRTVYNLGIFRAPQGWKRVTGPVERHGDTLTATLHSESAGRPGITTRVVFVRSDGVWKLSTQSVCEGVRTVGLPIACGG